MRATGHAELVVRTRNGHPVPGAVGVGVRGGGGGGDGGKPGPVNHQCRARTGGGGIFATGHAELVLLAGGARLVALRVGVGVRGGGGNPCPQPGDYLHLLRGGSLPDRIRRELQLDAGNRGFPGFVVDGQNPLRRVVGADVALQQDRFRAFHEVVVGHHHPVRQEGSGGAPGWDGQGGSPRRGGGEIGGGSGARPQAHVANDKVFVERREAVREGSDDRDGGRRGAFR